MKNLITILLVLVTFSLSAQTELESKMTLEINELRANPKSFIPHVEKYIMLNEKIIDRIKSGKCEVTSSNKSGVDVINERIYAANELITDMIASYTKGLNKVERIQKKYMREGLS